MPLLKTRKIVIRPREVRVTEVATVEKSSRRIVPFVTAIQSVTFGYATLLEVLMEPQQKLERTSIQMNRKLPLRSTTAPETMSTIVVVAVRVAVQGVHTPPVVTTTGTAEKNEERVLVLRC